MSCGRDRCWGRAQTSLLYHLLQDGWNLSHEENLCTLIRWKGFLQWLKGEESSCQCRRCRRCAFYPLVRKIPWRRKWQPTPVFLPGKSHGQRSLSGYSPWDHKRVGHGLSTKRQQQMEDCKVMKKVKVSSPVVSNSLGSHGLRSTRLLCPWILQARVLEWVAISFSRGSSWPRDWIRVSCIAFRFFTIWTTREAPWGHEARDN